MKNKEPKWDETTPTWDETSDISEEIPETVLDKAKFADRPLEAAAAAFGNPFQLGPKLDVLAQDILAKLPNSPENVNEALRAQGFTGDIQPPAPAEEREKEAKAYRALLEKYNPAAYGVGAVARELPLSYVGVPAKALGVTGKAIPGLANVINTLGQGAIVGGATSDAETPFELASDIAGGATESIPFALGGAAMQKTLEGLPKPLRSSADESYLKTLGYSKKDIKNILEKEGPEGIEKLRKLGRKAKDVGIITPFSSPQSRFEKLDDLIKSKESELGSILQETQKTYDLIPGLPKFSLEDVRDEILNEYVESYKKRNAGVTPPLDSLENFKKALNKITERAEGFHTKKLGPIELQGSKVSLNEASKFNAGDNPSDVIEAARLFRTKLKQKIEDSQDLTQDITKSSSAKIKDVNKTLGEYYKMQEATENALAKELKGGGGELRNTAEGMALLGIDPRLFAAKTYADLKPKYGSALGGAAKDATASTAEFLTKRPASTGVLAPTSAVEKFSKSLSGVAPAIEKDQAIAKIEPKDKEESAQLAERVLQSGEPDSEGLANLLNIMSNSGEQKRKAVMFDIMQRKNYRELLDKIKKQPVIEDEE